jgi:hypothetical protein
MKSFFDLDDVPKASNSFTPRNFPPPPPMFNGAYDRY